MQRIVLAALAVISLASLAGCRSQEHRLADLQAEYDLRIRQEWADCYGLALDRGNTARVQKCNAEDAKLAALEQQIEALTRELTR